MLLVIVFLLINLNLFLIILKFSQSLMIKTYILMVTYYLKVEVINSVRNFIQTSFLTDVPESEVRFFFI